MANDSGSLSHTKWNCKYHIVFAPKYRRQEIYGKIKQDIGQILRKLCEAKRVEIIEAEACPDHIHMLVSSCRGTGSPDSTAGAAEALLQGLFSLTEIWYDG